MAGTLHMPLHERMLDKIAQDEAWEGNVEAPVGAFATLHLQEETREMIELAYQDRVEGGTISKWWLARQDSDGHEFFIEYTSREDLTIAYRSLMAEYDAWDDIDGSEVG